MCYLCSKGPKQLRVGSLHSLLPAGGVFIQAGLGWLDCFASESVVDRRMASRAFFNSSKWPACFFGRH